MCDHKDAISIRSSVLRPGEELVGYSAAWCPTKGCGAFRDASATTIPEPWQLPGQWNKESYIEIQKDTTVKLVVTKKTKKTNKKVDKGEIL